MLEVVTDIFKSLCFEYALCYQNLCLDFQVIVPEFRLHDSTCVLANTVATLTLVSKIPK